MTDTQKIVVTRGLPASGKTTWAKAWVLKDPLRRARVSRDDIRRALFVVPTYEKDQEELVTTTERQMVRDLATAGRSVVVDATHLRPAYVRQWRKLAGSLGLELEIEEFPIELDEAVKRDHDREDGVGKEVIQRMYDKYTSKGRFLPIQDDEPPVPELYVPRPGTPPAIIVDIDGTLALNTGGRSPYDYSRVHEDTLNEPVATVVQVLRHTHTVIIMSGRDGECYEQTEAWLASHYIKYDALLMRETSDKRKDSIVKRELFDEYVRDRWNVELVLDDRNQVVDMWRSLGLTCFQVAPGDF